MDLSKLFDPHTEVKFDYRGVPIVYTYRDPSAPEWLEYQRRSANFKIIKKSVTASEDAVGARLWLHDKIFVKAEAVDGDTRTLLDRPLPANINDQAIMAYLTQSNFNDEGN